MEFNSQIINIIQGYCMSKPLAYESRPFGEHPICYRLMGKIFVQFIPVESFYRITLKCTPDKAELYRQLFPDVVMRGYHCPPVHQPYWNTVNLDLFADLDLLLQMIDEAYDAVAASFSRKTKAEDHSKKFDRGRQIIQLSRYRRRNLYIYKLQLWRRHYKAPVC